VALEGVTVAVRVSVPPNAILVDVLFKDMSVTSTLSVLTMTVHDAFLLPSTVVAVITAVPALMPSTTPPETAATSVLLLFHVTFLFAAFSGSTLA
jgi:hypothetical protein